MSQSASPTGLPGAMTDTLEFVRNMWGAMKVPGMAMPSLSPDEINKQITDLKAVESWLQLNMNMLRSSIQALEVQSATLSTLQSMSESFAQAVSPHPEPEEKPSFESPFAAFTAASAEAAKPATPQSSHAEAPFAMPLDTSAMAAQLVNPAAWWNVVQDQFSQAVGNAMAPTPKKPARKSPVTAKKAAGKSTAKSATKSATKAAPAKSAAKAKTPPSRSRKTSSKS